MIFPGVKFQSGSLFFSVKALKNLRDLLCEHLDLQSFNNGHIYKTDASLKRTP